MAKNIQSLQLLRNTTVLYATREAALDALTGNTAPPAGTQDGTPVLARYKGEDDKIYTLVGYYADGSKIGGSTSGETNMTVFDFEGTAADVDKLRQEINAKLGDGVTSANTATAQFAALSGNGQSQSGETSVEGAKRYADEKVRAALDALDYNLAKDDNKVVVSFEQKDGKISGTSENITSVKLSGLSSTADTKIAATDTLGDALAKLQGQIDSMDLSAVGTDGSVITSVSEEDGKVSASTTPVKDVKLTGYVKDTSKTGDIAATDDIEDALSKLENKVGANKITNADKSIVVTEPTGTATTTDVKVNIKSGEHVLAKDGNAGLYTNIAISAVTGTELSNLGTNVKEAYKLVGTDNTKLGEYIKIYKDSSLYNVYLGHVDDTITSSTNPTVVPGTGDTALCFIYLKTDGTYELVAVNVEEFIEENEFASGVTWDSTAKKVKGVVDSSSEKNSGGTAFLTVGADGFKVDGIKQEIIDRIGELDATVGTTTIATDKHVAVQVVEEDGVITAVTVTEDNIADADDLATLSGKTFTVATSSNESIITAVTAAADGTKSVDLITDASKIKMSGFTSTDALSGITSSSSVTEAFLEVDKVITENEEIVSTALNDLEATKAEKTALEAEIAARKAVDGQSGDTYAANTTVPYISAATSLNDADVKLANALATFENDGIKGVQVNGINLPETNNQVNVQISSVAASGTTSSPIVVNTDNSTGAVTLQILQIDCGEY